jgi:hypothetical protein
MPGRLIVMAIATASMGIHAQRTALADLEGIWTTATMTPLAPARPAAKATHPAEAADYDGRPERQTATNNTATRLAGSGHALSPTAASLILDPSDGRVPTDAGGWQRAAARTQARRARGPDWP